jgi:hypothetical protein
MSEKNKDTNGKLAYDNAIAALTVACIHCPALAPEGNVDRLWEEAIFQKLPIRYDEDESQKLNEYLFDRVSAQDPNTLGANSCRLPKLLGLFSDIYSTELVSDELKEKIKVALVGMDRAQLTQMSFTEKQQKKISKIIAAGQMN